MCLCHPLLLILKQSVGYCLVPLPLCNGIPRALLGWLLRVLLRGILTYGSCCMLSLVVMVQAAGTLSAGCSRSLCACLVRVVQQQQLHGCCGWSLNCAATAGHMFCPGCQVVLQDRE